MPQAGDDEPDLPTIEFGDIVVSKHYEYTHTLLSRPTRLVFSAKA